jgi:hypothetical protein
VSGTEFTSQNPNLGGLGVGRSIDLGDSTLLYGEASVNTSLGAIGDSYRPAPLGVC